MNAVYSINNSLFASNDLIFGWCFWNEGTTPSPVAELDDEQIVALIKAFNGPLHGDIREALVAEQTARTPAVDSESRPEIEMYGDFSGIADGALAMRTSEDPFPQVLPGEPKVVNFVQGGYVINGVKVDVSPKVASDFPDREFKPFNDISKIGDGSGIVTIAGQKFHINPAEPVPSVLRQKLVMKDFTMPTARTFMVSGQVEVGGELDTLLKLFTNVWLPIPGSHSDFFIRRRGEKSHIQITMHQDENDVPEYFSLHVGGEFAQFRTKYMAGECDDAKRYPLGDNWCMGSRVVAALKSEGVW